MTKDMRHQVESRGREKTKWGGLTTPTCQSTVIESKMISPHDLYRSIKEHMLFAGPSTCTFLKRVHIQTKRTHLFISVGNLVRILKGLDSLVCFEKLESEAKVL